MVFYTGDPHGDVAEIVEFCRQMRLQPADTLVILGDVGGQLLSERAGYLRQGAAQRLRPNGFVHPRQPRVPARPSARVWAAGLERRPGVCPAGVFPCPVRRGRRDLHAGRAGSPGDWRRLQRGQVLPPHAGLPLVGGRAARRSHQGQGGAGAGRPGLAGAGGAEPHLPLQVRAGGSLSARHRPEQRGRLHRAVAGYHRRPPDLRRLVLRALAHQQADREDALLVPRI